MTIVEGNYSNANGWEGDFHNQLLPDGTYFYIIEIPGKAVKSGYVQIMR